MGSAKADSALNLFRNEPAEIILPSEFWGGRQTISLESLPEGVSVFINGTVADGKSIPISEIDSIEVMADSTANGLVGDVVLRRDFVNPILRAFSISSVDRFSLLVENRDPTLSIGNRSVVKFQEPDYRADRLVEPFALQFAHQGSYPRFDIHDPDNDKIAINFVGLDLIDELQLTYDGVPIEDGVSTTVEFTEKNRLTLAPIDPSFAIEGWSPIEVGSVVLIVDDAFGGVLRAPLVLYMYPPVANVGIFSSDFSGPQMKSDLVPPVGAVYSDGPASPRSESFFGLDQGALELSSWTLSGTMDEILGISFSRFSWDDEVELTIHHAFDNRLGPDGLSVGYVVRLTNRENHWSEDTCENLARSIREVFAAGFYQAVSGVSVNNADTYAGTTLANEGFWSRHCVMASYYRYESYEAYR